MHDPNDSSKVNSDVTWFARRVSLVEAEGDGAWVEAERRSSCWTTSFEEYDFPEFVTPLFDDNVVQYNYAHANDSRICSHLKTMA